MVSNSEIINKKNLCNIVTPELITDLVNAIWYAEDNGWREREDAEELQTKIEKIGKFCSIVKIKDIPLRRYENRE